MGRGTRQAHTARQPPQSRRSNKSEESRCDVELQNKDECGLCALRHALAPHYVRHDVELPSERELRKHARALENDEAALLEDDDTGLLEEAERADNRGNFNIDVLMRAAMCQQLGGAPLTLEYWAGQHQQAAQNVELAFILGNGFHWWCIRPCGKNLEEWEEVDSLGKSHLAKWPSREELVECLRDRDETVLVLYPAPREEDATPDDEEGEVEIGNAKLKRVSKKAELKAARNRQKEVRRLARQTHGDRNGSGPPNETAP